MPAVNVTCDSVQCLHILCCVRLGHKLRLEVLQFGEQRFTCGYEAVGLCLKVASLKPMRVLLHQRVQTPQNIQKVGRARHKKSSDIDSLLGNSGPITPHFGHPQAGIHIRGIVRCLHP